MAGNLTKSFRQERGPVEAASENDLKNILDLVQQIKRKTSRKIEDTMAHDEVTNVIPDTWEVTSVDSLFNLIDYRGKNPPKSKDGKRLITAKNIRMGYIAEEPITFVSDKTYRDWMVRGFPRAQATYFL